MEIRGFSLFPEINRNPEKKKEKHNSDHAPKKTDSMREYDIDLVVKNGDISPIKNPDTDYCGGTGTYGDSCRGTCHSCNCQGTYGCS